MSWHYVIWFMLKFETQGHCFRSGSCFSTNSLDLAIQTVLFFWSSLMKDPDILIPFSPFLCLPKLSGIWPGSTLYPDQKEILGNNSFSHCLISSPLLSGPSLILPLEWHFLKFRSDYVTHSPYKILCTKMKIVLF